MPRGPHAPAQAMGFHRRRVNTLGQAEKARSVMKVLQQRQRPQAVFGARVRG